MENKLAPVICYKTKKPVYYNKGTKWETTCDKFLAYYGHGTFEEAQKEADEINRTKPEKLFNGTPIDWEKVDYFFAGEQEEMY